MNLCPRSAFFFNGSFIKLIKEKDGGLFAEIPFYVR
jgi:hypothetical protein